MKASELKKGMIISDGGQLYVVTEVEHRTPGNLGAMYQTTLKNILDGRIANRRYSAAESVDKVDLEAKKGQFLFHDHSGFHFMDMETYETFDTSLPDEEEIRGKIASGQEIEYWRILDRVIIVRIKS